MSETNKPEARRDRDLVPTGGTPLTRENTRQAFEPLADSVQRLGDSIDALHDRVRDQKHILDDAELPEAFGRDADEREEERTRLDAEHAAQLEALRKQLRQPITGRYLDDLARGGPSVIEWFFSDGEVESK
jgi:hypothetical protein